MFWLITLAMVLLVLVPVLRIVLSGTASDAKAADLDLQVYKDQLNEVDRDVARGLLSQADAGAAKTEVSRRILAADKRAAVEDAGQAAGRKISLVLSLGIAVLVFGGTFALYQRLGASAMPDQPLQARIAAAKASRPTQAEAEAQTPAITVDADENHLKLVAQLRAVMKDRPNDARGFRLLANHEARLANFAAARVAQQKVLDILDDATKEADYTDLAEIMIVAAGGYVSLQAEDALAKAMRLNPKSPKARYYSGLTLAQNGRADVAYRMWQALLEEGPEDAPWVQLIHDQIGLVARAAGIEIVDPNAPGPSSEDVKNAQSMSDEDRQAMIRSMVAGLADRLGTDGGGADEWARLIRAYGVLGETEKAASAWTTAQSFFTDNTAALALLREAAQTANVAQ